MSTLISCRVCGKEAVTEAKTCPQCGVSLPDHKQYVRDALYSGGFYSLIGAVALWHVLRGNYFLDARLHAFVAVCMLIYGAAMLIVYSQRVKQPPAPASAVNPPDATPEQPHQEKHP
jgi:hypothetical protein